MRYSRALVVANPIAGRGRGVMIGQLVVDGLAAGIGLDVLVVREVERRRRGPITRWNYVWALLRVLPKYTPPRLTVMIPGEDPVTAGFVLISNCSRYAGLFRLLKHRQPDEGL